MNYSIETPCEPEPFTVEVNEVPLTLHRTVSKRHVFNGISHKEILDEFPIGESWSSEVTTFSEIQKLFEDLRESESGH